MTMLQKMEEDAMTREGNPPPPGVAPFYIPAETRIRELAQAIDRYAETGITGCIVQWAQEIVEQCRLIETMRKTDHHT